MNLHLLESMKDYLLIEDRENKKDLYNNIDPVRIEEYKMNAYDRI